MNDDTQVRQVADQIGLLAQVSGEDVTLVAARQVLVYRRSLARLRRPSVTRA